MIYQRSQTYAENVVLVRKDATFMPNCKCLPSTEHKMRHDNTDTTPLMQQLHFGRFSSSRILGTSELSIYMVNYMYNGIQLKYR